MYEHGRRSIYPCQSTGLWYARSTPPTHAFLQGLHGYLRTRPNEWEQKAYQLLVMRYLIGLGDELAPLRYRLLPTAQFINIEYYEERQRQRLPVDGMVVRVRVRARVRVRVRVRRHGGWAPRLPHSPTSGPQP